MWFMIPASLPSIQPLIIIISIISVNHIYWPAMLPRLTQRTLRCFSYHNAKDADTIYALATGVNSAISVHLFSSVDHQGWRTCCLQGTRTAPPPQPITTHHRNTHPRVESALPGPVSQSAQAAAPEGPLPEHLHLSREPDWPMHPALLLSPALLQPRGDDRVPHPRQQGHR
jgi:hypothetical protein